jgi:hypothetical protein
MTPLRLVVVIRRPRLARRYGSTARITARLPKKLVSRVARKPAMETCSAVPRAKNAARLADHGIDVSVVLRDRVDDGGHGGMVGDVEESDVQLDAAAAPVDLEGFGTLGVPHGSNRGARSVGAHVIGTGRSTARSRVLELGADSFVDLEQDRWEDAIGQVDVVYDTIGGEVLARSQALVKSGGTLVTVISPPTDIRNDIRTVNFIREPNRAQLIELAHLVDAGKLRPQLGAVYPLAEARKAFTAKSGHHVVGKVVLQP